VRHQDEWFLRERGKQMCQDCLTHGRLTPVSLSLRELCAAFCRLRDQPVRAATIFVGLRKLRESRCRAGAAGEFLAHWLRQIAEFEAGPSSPELSRDFLNPDHPLVMERLGDLSLFIGRKYASQRGLPRSSRPNPDKVPVVEKADIGLR
jgi:hypothetical protein